MQGKAQDITISYLPESWIQGLLWCTGTVSDANEIQPIRYIFLDCGSVEYPHNHSHDNTWSWEVFLNAKENQDIPVKCKATPSWSRQMATLPVSGSEGGFFFLLKVFFSFYSRLVHAQDGRLDWSEVSVQSVGFLSEATLFLIGSIWIGNLKFSELDLFGLRL